MKVIFLDVDGVLNGVRTRDVILTKITRFMKRQLKLNIDVYDIFGVRTCMVRRLSKIIRKTGAVVVLSSSWRVGYFQPYNELLDRQKLLHDKFERFGIDVVGRTCADSFIDGRGKQIEEYIQSHNIDPLLENISSYVIIDDECNDFYMTPNYYEWCKNIRHHFVHTSVKKGLTRKNVRQAIHILNTPVKNNCY